MEKKKNFAGNKTHDLFDGHLFREEERRSKSATVFRGSFIIGSDNSKTETNITSTQSHVRFMSLFDIFFNYYLRSVSITHE